LNFRHTGTLALAADVANGYKHLARDRKPNIDAGARVLSYGSFATSEADEPPPEWEHLVAVVGEHMTMQNAHDVADRCIREWHVFLHEHGWTTPPS
jgi:hypothetical protein